MNLKPHTYPKDIYTEGDAASNNHRHAGQRHRPGCPSGTGKTGSRQQGGGFHQCGHRQHPYGRGDFQFHSVCWRMGKGSLKSNL